MHYDIFIIFLITLTKIEYENVSLHDIRNLRTVVNTMTADDKYSPRNSQSFPQPIQMELSKKQKICLNPLL